MKNPLEWKEIKKLKWICLLLKEISYEFKFLEKKKLNKLKKTINSEENRPKYYKALKSQIIERNAKLKKYTKE